MSNASNYIPIDLISYICKVMESIICEEIMEHMTKHVFSDKQYWFINGRSTFITLQKVLDIWTHILGCCGQNDVIFIDFMKAIDQVPHIHFIGNVESFGIGCDII